ncbi:phosphotransferase enzyme family protein [Pedococcus sp. 5OH_020]|uniref:phosphotransferase enzyme family protein n=1 Tax=Pedococcus sp. 5OH_020 TaxID=2989814 RepID=UPI0022EA0E12|nr:phosphotransferase [Pedococcus sp. 5OH_020]
MHDDVLADFPYLWDAVCQRYGLRGRSTATRLTGGYANDVLRVDQDGHAPVVLHIKRPPSSAASMDWEHRLVRAVSTELPEALAPRPALDGSTWFWHNNRPVWLVPWADGVPAAHADRHAVAVEVGRLHSCGVRVSKRPDHRRLLQLPLPAVGPYPSEFDAWQPLIHHERGKLGRLVEWIDRDRRPMTGLTHNDIFAGNVLVRGGRVSAVLDWEEAELDWLVWDLASAMLSFCSSQGGELNRDVMNDFVRAYRAAGGPVPPEEDDLLVPLARTRLLLEVLRAPYDRHPQWDRQLASLRAFTILSGTAG